MNDKILVRLMDIETERMISAFYTTNWSEVLKMYSFMKENNISYDITISEEDSIKYKDSVCFIKDISLTFGGNTGINVINIWVEVC